MNVERLLTIELIEKASEDLDHLTGLLEVSEADVINQAIQVYRYIQGQITKGNRIAIFKPDEMTFHITSIKTGSEDDESGK